MAVQKPEFFPLPSFRKFSGNIAFLSQEASFTFREFEQAVINTSQRLRDTNIRDEKIVAVLASSSIEYIILLHSLWNLKKIAVLVNIRWPSEVTFRRLRSLHVQHLFCNSSPPADLQKQFACRTISSLIDGEIKISKKDKFRYTGLSPDQDATIIFTSGSTGEAKAALHTIGNHYFNALGSNRNINVKSDDRWLVSLPLYHVGGLAITFRTLLGGGTAVFQNPDSDISDTIREYNVTHISLVATQLYRLLQDRDNISILKSFKAILLGGGPIPEVLVREALKHRLPVYTSYGSTEMSSQITTTRTEDSLKNLMTAGCPLPYRRVQISPDSEILVRGKTLFRGYREGNRLITAVDGEGWFHTGDIGRVNKSGYLKVLGRKDNMFISGGENIHPEEIEQIISELNEVEEAVVVPVPDREYGQRPVGFIKLKNGLHLVDKIPVIDGFLRDRLPGYKVPDHYLNWPEREMYSGSIKINRSQFTRLAQEHLSTE